MSIPGTWCDNVIIQAVANIHICVIYITDSDDYKPDDTIITPAVYEGQPKIVFLGYINGLLMFQQRLLKTVKEKNWLT